MKYYIVDAFTDKPFGGNPAGVVILDNNYFPDEKLMLKVAAELRYSETAFVRQDSKQEFTTRYFTPTAEVELCGHATIASFHVLNMLGLAEGHCLCHTLSGDLTVVADSQIMMDMAVPRIVATLSDEEVSAAYRAMGLQYVIIDPRPQIVYSGLPDIMLPIATLHELNSLQPDMDAVTSLTRKLEAVSIHPYVILNDGYTAHVRDFAPLYDIPEEAATGTANASLTFYLAQNNLIPPVADCRFLQGETMGRPSVVATRLNADGRLQVGGTATIVACGDLFL